MDLLEEYKATVEEQNQVIRELHEIDYAIQTGTSEISDIDSEIDKLQTDFESRKQTIISQYINDRTAAEVGGMRQQLRNYQQQAQLLPREQQQAFNSKSSDQYLQNLLGPIQEISNAKQLIESNRDKLDKVFSKKLLNSITLVPLETVSLPMMNLLLSNVKKLLKLVPPKIMETPIEHIIGIITFQHVSTDKLSAKVKTGFISIYFVLFIFLILKFKVVFLLFYIPVMSVSIFKLLRYNSAMLDIYLPYKYLEQTATKLQEMILEEGKRRKDADTKKIEDKFDTATQELAAKISELTIKIGAVLSDIRNDAKLQEADIVKTGIDSDLTALTNKKAEKLKALQESQAKEPKQQEKLQALAEKLEGLKQQISQANLHPVSPGSSQLLLKHFFLGFNTDGTLADFNFQGKSTLVFYKGDSSSVCNDMILMMIMQLLSNMNPLSLSINIIDTLNGCSAYSVFKAEELDNIFQLYATDQQATDALATLHEVLLDNNKKILTTSEDINSYNEVRINRESFTEPYTFLFIQNAPKTIFSNQLFLQLCRVGPKVGIIPFLFLNMDLTYEIAAKKDKKETENMYNLVSSIETDNYYFYNSEDNYLELRSDLRDKLIAIFGGTE